MYESLFALAQITGAQVTLRTEGSSQSSGHDTGEHGDTVSARSRIEVVPVAMPSVFMPTKKTIYLTFDDGPGPYTGHLLDVLNSYDVKGTFFVTANFPEYYDNISRAFQAGHSIGVHTTTHDYHTIYASESVFFDDFFNMEKIILEQTGEYSRLFRFPGGSSNTVSRFNPGIMSRLTRIMNDLGYRYFDWSVYAGDTSTNNSDEILEIIKDGCSKSIVSVVIQHDIKSFSVAVVEDVIQWGLSNGYDFRPLQLDSPGFEQKLSN